MGCRTTNVTETSVFEESLSSTAQLWFNQVMLRRLLLVIVVGALLVLLVLPAGCKGVGTLCQTSGSTEECGTGLICTFTGSPGDPNDPNNNLPATQFCLRQCETSTDCGEAELCQIVYCSNQQSCQTGAVPKPTLTLCEGGAGGTGGAGGIGGMGGTAGMGGSAGAGGSLGCDSTANGFIKTIDPASNFNQTNFVEKDTTNIPDAWNRYSIELLIDAGLVDQLLQIGFSATASNFEPSGVFYDNLVVEPGPQYTQDFESLDQSSPTALAEDGWIVFATVFNTDDSAAYGYGPDPAPNNTGGFCGIALNQGGVAQGAQQLVIISDYNNTQAQTSGQRVEANTFQERTVTAEDVGDTIIFSFDAKRGNINEGCPIGGAGGTGGTGGAGGAGGIGGTD